jgi:ubiquinone/menaquinone biosynthesis C-methylase UbiE
VLEPVDYNVQQHTDYARGRALTPEGRAGWMRAFSRRVTPNRPLAVLDLGSGTGRFTPALADTFGGPVYGVEPADAMRATALELAQHPQVTYLAGAAEAIPLPDASVDVVLMYLSFHHVRDKPAAVQEIARVLRPGAGAQVLIRSTFSDRMPNFVWHRFFPRARTIEQEMFLPVADVERLFAPAGMRRLALDEVPYRLAPNLADYTRRMRLRTISVFEYLSEDEITEGFEAMEAAAAADTEMQPLDEMSDLLVLSGPTPN